ncbi:MAG: hypothetical protein M3209_09625 [Acidobacteriota bacterium]|nr:hypothetical protein [Acidobacteriota bacterium]
MNESSQQILTAGRELDLLIRDKVLKRKFPENRCPVCGWRLAESQEMGCLPNDCSLRPAPDRRADEPAAYSSLINMAWIVVEHLREQGWLVYVSALPDDYPFPAAKPLTDEMQMPKRAACSMDWIGKQTAEDVLRRSKNQPFAIAETPALAICLAALKAVEAEEEPA